MKEDGSEKPKPMLLFLFITSLVVGVSYIGFQKMMSKPVIEIKKEKTGSTVGDAEKENVTDVARKSVEPEIMNAQRLSCNVKEDGDEGNMSESDDDDDYEDDEDSIDEKLDTAIKNDYNANDGPFKMVLCINMSLSMGKGKMCAQCGHATLGAYRTAEKHCGTAITWWHRMGQVMRIISLYLL